MKKKTLFALLMAFSFSLAACSFTENDFEDEEEETDMDEISIDLDETVSEDSEEISELVATALETIERNEVTVEVDNSTEDTLSEGDNHDEIADLWLKRAAILSNSDLNSFEKTQEVYDVNKSIEALNCYDFSDTKIAFLGDSITAGNGGVYNEYGVLNSYANYTCDILGAKYYNYSIPGSCLGSVDGYDGMCYRVDTIPEDMDIVVVFGGFNDFNQKAFFGDDTCSEGSFTYDCRNLFEKLSKKFPDKPVYIIICYKNIAEEIDDTNPTPFNYYLSYQRQLAKEYGFKTIEMHEVNFMNNNNPDVAQTYFSDNIHPNDAGYRSLARFVASEIIADYN